MASVGLRNQAAQSASTLFDNTHTARIECNENQSKSRLARKHLNSEEGAVHSHGKRCAGCKDDADAVRPNGRRRMQQR